MREIYGKQIQTSKCVEAVEGEWEIGYFLQHLVTTPARKIGFNSYLLTTHEIFVYTFVYIYSLSSVCQLSVRRLSIMRVKGFRERCLNIKYPQIAKDIGAAVYYF